LRKSRPIEFGATESAFSSPYGFSLFSQTAVALC
jgi:hypothetical protein